MKKIISFLIVTTLLMNSCFAALFTDISGHWAQVSILNAYYDGFVNGYTDGTFLPNNTITRAEFVTILAKVLDSSIVIDIDGYDSIFTYHDLPDSHWCKPFYNKLVYYGYVFTEEENSLYQEKGRTFITSILGDSFKPSEPITRAEAVSLIAYFLDDEKLEEESPIIFSDIDESPLAMYIYEFSHTGIIKGYSDGTFKPNNTITRAEVATIISDLYSQKFYFKTTKWINENNIENAYTENLTPEEVIRRVLRLEQLGSYDLAYEYFSTDYKFAYEIYSYKDYMKKSYSHLSNSYLDISFENNLTIKQEAKEDNMIAFSVKDSTGLVQYINLISINDKWYINSPFFEKFEL